MIRIFRASNGPNCMKNARIFVHLVGTVFVLLAFFLGRNVYAAPTLRIAVAPFAGAQELGEISSLSVAHALATRLSQSNIERLIAPGDFVAESVFEPRASEVRRWAYNSAVDTIVVGRVFSKNGPGKDGPRVVEAVVRSGHSGAELSRHEVVVPHGGEFDRSVDKLATAILVGLGHVEPPADDIQTGTPVPVADANAAVGERADGDADSSERGLDGMLSESVFEPRASEVRRWAYNSAVDTIVVGRVFSKNGPGKEGPRVVEAVVRSGHSGAELSRHEVVVPHGGEFDRSVDQLATAILVGLGHVEPPADDIQAGTPAPVADANAAVDEHADGNADSSEPGLDGMLSESAFRSDAPIEIKAEEAEILNRNQGRKLIFQRNVWVRKDNVTLRSDRLEASYQKGESEPSELIAQGKVKIVQNDRHAKCDRAVYLREANRLTCTGRAELAQGCDIIRGESIEFDLAGDQARVEGGASVVIHSREKDAEDAGNEPSACAENRGQM
jgi:lipopolysaccharide transport protein LptA